VCLLSFVELLSGGRPCRSTGSGRGSDSRWLSFREASPECGGDRILPSRRSSAHEHFGDEGLLRIEHERARVGRSDSPRSIRPLGSAPHDLINRKRKDVPAAALVRLGRGRDRLYGERRDADGRVLSSRSAVLVSVSPMCRLSVR
jgi:hypothetical protein